VAVDYPWPVFAWGEHKTQSFYHKQDAARDTAKDVIAKATSTIDGPITGYPNTEYAGLLDA
jgi:hypothetical protein